MKKKNIIKMILLQFGYSNIQINTFWTGTADGAYPNRLAYDIEAEKNGGFLEAAGADFQEAIQDLFYKILGTDINENIIHYIDEEVFRELK